MNSKEKTFLQSCKEPYPILVTLIIGSVIAFLILNLTVFHYSKEYEIVAVLLMIPALFLITIVRFIP